MGGFIYSPRDENAPVDPDVYWARKAKRERDAAAARLAATPVSIPSLSDLYRDGDPARQAEEKQRQAEIASGPFAFTGQGMPLPRNDPKAIEARLNIINKE